jgi:hypothetical protein
MLGGDSGALPVMKAKLGTLLAGRLGLTVLAAVLLSFQQPSVTQSAVKKF